MVGTSMPQRLVGRTSELAELRAAYELAATGRPVTVLLGGEAGVGKTRLVTEFAAEARASGARVVIGQCVELGDSGIPYAPVASALRELAGELGPQRLLELAGPGRDAVTRLLPELGAYTTADAIDGQGQLFEVVTVLLEQASADHPLVLLIEDVHWADRSTADLLRFAVRALGEAALLLVLTFRSDEVGRGHKLRPVLAELERLRNVHRTDLPRLSRQEVGDLLTSLLGRPADPADVSRIYERSEGNPFFVEELLNAESLSSLPDSLRDVLLVRSEQLSDQAQETLRTLAVGGNRVAHKLLAEVSDLPAADLDAALREAVTAQVIRVDGESYVFRHALMRDALHEDVLPGAHGRLHARYAEALENGANLVVPRTAAAIEIAHHWYAAHEQERAFAASVKAAEYARQAYAYADALKMLEKAIELWDRVPAPQDVSGGTRFVLLDHAARMAFHAGELERSLALVNTASGESGIGMVELASLLELKARVVNDLMRPDVLDIIRDALQRIPDDPALGPRAQLLTRLASRHMLDGNYPESLEVAAAALESARLSGERTAEFRSHHVRGPTLMHLGRVDEAFAEFDLSREVAGDDPGMLVGYHINYSDSLFHLGRFAEAAQSARDGVKIAHDIGLARSLGTMLTGNTAEPLIALGEWDEAERLVGRALELEPPDRHYWALLTLEASLHLRRGQLAEAETALTEVTKRIARRKPGPQYTVPLAAAFAELRLAQDDHDAAWEHVRAVLDEPRALIQAYDLPLLAVGARAVAQRLRAGDSTADADATRVREIADQAHRWGNADVWLSLIQAELAGNFGDDPASWQAAVDGVDGAGGPAHLLPYTRYRLAEAQIARGNRDSAATALSEAAGHADRLGAQLIRRAIDDFSRKARLPLTGAAVGGEGSREFGLTSREREVLGLIAAGRSNREIGEELFISTKTASVHVSNILGKMEAASRGEAAAIAHRHGLVDDLAAGPR